jgi:NAD(P)-dependent dehydrogenase (short-subunit alcohol dehydrogenase family)
MRLKDKVAIITGSSKGAGRATARLFAQEGAHVVINARDGELLRKVHDEISVFGRKVISVPCDVANWEDVKKMARIAMAEFEKIDILVNMVGGSQPPVPLEDLDVELWDKQIKSNLYSAFYCSKAVVKQMKNQRGGKIVNVASVAGRSVSQFGGVFYAAAKAGVLGFTRQLALELAPFGIRVNAIAPGGISSERMQAKIAQLSDEARKKMMEKIPLGRIGEPEEYASAVLFLASDESSYITGATLDVNGGLVML